MITKSYVPKNDDYEILNATCKKTHKTWLLDAARPIQIIVLHTVYVPQTVAIKNIKTNEKKKLWLLK